MENNRNYFLNPEVPQITILLNLSQTEIRNRMPKFLKSPFFLAFPNPKSEI
jgi:hypothetical protein